MPPHLSFRLATAESVHNSHRVILVLLGSLMALVAACRGLNFRSYMNRNSNGGCEGTLALGSKCCSKDWDVEKLFGKPKFRESSETDVKRNHLARQLPVGLFLHPHGASFNDEKNKWSTGGIQMPNSSMHNAWNRAKRAWQARVFATDVQFCAWMIHYVLKGFEHCSPCSPLWNGLVEVLISSRMFSGYTPTVYFWQCSAVTFGCLNVFPDVRFEMTRHEAWDILHGVVFVNIF